jgi:glycine/D-amino acid oxidase-like deaminating enzyme
MSRNLSYWDRTVFLRKFDVLVIGGGIVGCTAALECIARNPGLRIGVVERGTIPDGASSRNAGFACFGSMTEILSDISVLGEDASMDLVRLRNKGLQSLLGLLSVDAIDYRLTGGYEVFLEEDAEAFQGCLSRMDEINERLRPAFGGQVFVRDDAAGVQMGLNNIAHIIRHPYEGVLNPGKMMETLWRKLTEAGITLLNGLKIERIIDEQDQVVLIDTKDHTLCAKALIVATNAYTGRLLPDLQVVPARNQVYVTNKIPGLKLDACFHYNRGYVYFRSVDGRLLIGGARNIDLEHEATDEYGLTSLIRNELERFTKTHLIPSDPFEFEFSWSGIIGTGPDKTPIVDNVTERIVVAARLGGMGVAIGCLVGSQAATRILARL